MGLLVPERNSSPTVKPVVSVVLAAVGTVPCPVYGGDGDENGDAGSH